MYKLFFFTFLTFGGCCSIPNRNVDALKADAGVTRWQTTQKFQLSDEKRGLRLLHAYVYLISDRHRYDVENGPLRESLMSGWWAMSFSVGMDFHGDYVGWSCWYEWLAHHDPKTAFKCFDGDYHLDATYLFCAKIAAASGDQELMVTFLEHARKLQNPERDRLLAAIGNHVYPPSAAREGLYPDGGWWRQLVTELSEFEPVWLLLVPPE